MKRIFLFGWLMCLALISATAQSNQLIEPTLDDIFSKGTFRANLVYGLNPLNDGEKYATMERGENGITSIVAWSYKTGKVVDTLVSGFTLKKLNGGEALRFFNYKFSADEKKVLLGTDPQQIYRHSTRENNYVFNLETKKLSALSENGKQSFADFNPLGNKVAFMRDNNLFIKDLTTKNEKQITDDGEWNKIINGGTDWVYEEEFAFTKAWFWSPDGKKIAFYKFDEERVKQFNMAMYGELYPKDYEFKYPKAGEDNAIVTIHLYDMVSGKTTPVDIGAETNQYIPRMQWTRNASKLCVRRMNRWQNKLEFLMVDAKTGKSKVILTEENKAYIDINDNVYFLESGESFILTSEKDGFNHVYQYDMTGKQIGQITKGKHEVTDFYGINEKKGLVFYQAAFPTPMDRAVFSAKLNGKGSDLISAEGGTTTASYSSDFSYSMNYYSNANNPYVITVNDSKGKVVRKIEDNKALTEKMAGYKLGKKEFLTMETSLGDKLNAWMVKPVDFDPNKKYPVMMYVYGGPGSQTVQNRWGGSRDLWNQMLANEGYIVVSVDNRGTGGRGEAFKKSTYLNLGKLETIDQIEAGKWLAKQTYVDSERIGIWGWSFGGYMSSLCIAKGADVFKMAIAVAPVTTWRFYDTIYTERYLRTPQENPEGYDDNSPINFVKDIKGKYMIIHGLADDNVHFQNAAEMVMEMVNNNIPFDSGYYPNKNHSISGGKTSLHLYTKMTNYIKENL